MAPITVDPNALSGAGVSVGAVGDGLAAAMSTLTGTFNANTGQDSAGLLFGEQYTKAAGELLKAVSSGVNACRNIGYGVQITATNYSRAEANSDISGRSQPMSPPPCPAPVSAPGSPSATGGGVAEPVLWCVVEALIGDLWPNGDPSAMRAAAAAWRAFATPLHHVSVDMSGAYNAIGAQHMDEAELIQKPIRDIGTAFSDVAFSCEELAGALEQFASDVQQTQQAIRDLLHKLGSIGGIVGTFFEFLKGHGEEELHEIAEDIKTVLHHLKAEADAKSQIITQGKADVDRWALQLESWADRKFVDFFGEHVGSVLATDFNMFVDSEEGGFRWLVSTAEGLSALNPARFAYDPKGAAQTWGSIAELGNLVMDPAGTYARDPEGVKAILKGLARTDEWSKDRPMLGLTQNVLDVATLAIPGVGEGGAAADAASAAGRVARAADVADEVGGVARTTGKLGEIGRGAGALADVGKEGAGIAQKFDDIAKKPLAPEVPGGRPASLPETAERGVPAVTKEPVRDVPPVAQPAEAAAAKVTAAERASVPADVHPAPVAEPAAVGVAKKIPTTSAMMTPLNGVGDVLKPVESVASSGAEAVSGLRNGLGGVADSLGAGSHTPGVVADLGRGAEHAPVGVGGHGGGGATDAVGHGGGEHMGHHRPLDGQSADERFVDRDHDERGTADPELGGRDGQDGHPVVPGLSDETRDAILAAQKGMRPDPSEYLSSEYIDQHLDKFRDGAARYMPEDNLQKYGIAQRDGTSFVLTKHDADALIARTGGDPRAMERALGLPDGFLDENRVVRIDIPEPGDHNLRMPSGNEAGANDQWLPGGLLPDGMPEAVIDGGEIPPDGYRVTDLPISEG